MASKREQVLLALFAVLSGIAGVKVLRNKAAPLDIPAGGLLILRDGDPGTPDVTLNPTTYLWEHDAELELHVQGRDDEVRDATFDELAVKVGNALNADTTLGGLVDYLEPSAPTPDIETLEGAQAVKPATIVVKLHYTTSSPLN